jgi:hypothetical protein
MKTCRLYLVRLVSIGLLAFMLFNPAALMAEGQSEEDSRQQTLPVINVSITSKTATSVTTHNGDRFEVSQQTIIVGTDGRQVSIRKMFVPCEAELTYSTDDAAALPLAQLIRIHTVGYNPSWKYEGGRAE